MPAPVLLPGAVRAVVDALLRHGHATYVVGGCVRELLGGRPVRDFDLATSAPPHVVLAIFPRAVPIGMRHGTVMVPTPNGPVDVTSFRGGLAIEDDLALRDFTLNAMALDPRDGRCLDPHGGAADLAAGRLRAVGSARARLAEDPLRALRAARFTAQLAVEPDPELEEALPGVVEALVGVARERMRAELERLLVAPRAGAGLRVLRRSGIEAVLAPGVAEDAPEVVDALPVDLQVRLAGWLRGTRPAAILGRLRFARRMVEHVERLLLLHPVEARVASPRDAQLRRLIRHAGEDGLDALLALRDAELAVGSVPEGDRERVREGLAELRRRIEHARQQGTLALERRHLALGGGQVMAILGCGPGPRVGQALSFLTERVIDDPSCNEPEKLRSLLLKWFRRG
jgi:tRNA nucleotidyltransferase (CCA-adding enzyme)